MTGNFREAEVRWSTAHRTFPLLTGLGVAGALVLVAWIPPPRWIAFFALPLLLAPPLSALSALGLRETLPWVVGRHALAALAAVAVAMAPTAFAAALTHAHADSNLAEVVDFTAIIVSVGSLAGWLSLQFERFADSGAGLPPLGKTRWNPRRWGVGGAIGVALSLAALTVPGWAFFVGGPWGGGLGIVWYYSLWAGGISAAFLSMGLAIELSREPVVPSRD